MMFEIVFAETLGREGKFSDDPSDSGGATMFGITERVARAHGYDGPMPSLPLTTAKRIAKNQYWDLLRLDEIAELSPAIASELFDTGYNCGQGVAGTFLQRCLNVFNRGGTDYADVKVDGIIGPMTLDAFLAYLTVRAEFGETVLLRALNSMQGARYIELAEKREKDERFVFGWLKNRVT